MPHKGMVLTGGSLLSSVQMWAGGVCGVLRAGCWPVLRPGAPLSWHLHVPASHVPAYRCGPCGSSAAMASVLPAPSLVMCAGAEGVQSILSSAGCFWGKTKALPPRCFLGIPAPVCAPLLSMVREGAGAASALSAVVALPPASRTGWANGGQTTQVFPVPQRPWHPGPPLPGGELARLSS